MDILEEGGIYRHHMTYLDGAVLTFSVQDLRETATGVHGHLAIKFDDALLDSDLFNIARGGERLTLSNRAFKCLDETYQKERTSADQARLLGIFTNETIQLWRQRFTADAMRGLQYTEGIPMTLDPFIVEGGGTQFFGAPGAGKTYLCLLMAQSIDKGIGLLDGGFWRVKQGPVLYVNLERPARSLQNRLALVNKILGLDTETPLIVINARGQNIKSVQYSVMTSIREHKIQTVFIDSMSRSGMGSLNNDDVANAIIDILNGFGVTWVLIAHTPRADNTHAYGSMMQEAGEDVGVQVAFSKHGPTVTGLLLNTTKANDVPFARQYWRMDFDIGIGLTGFRPSNDDEFPDLGDPDAVDMKEKVIVHLQKVGTDNASEMSKTLKLVRQHLSTMLNNDPTFERVPKVGRVQLFKLKNVN